ncbi:MAG: hypothetical protein OXH57_11395 [Ekhidna sp.]|nr:hypothetical protein [Ekhidna sp.]
MSKKLVFIVLIFFVIVGFNSCGDDEASAVSSDVKTLNKSRLSLHKNNRVVSYNIGDRYAAFLASQGSGGIIEELTSDLYAHFNDDFDFITVIMNEKEKPENVSFFGRYANIQNDIQNIGIRNFDNSARYGSEKLQGILLLTALSYLRGGPSLHEIAHNWANFLIKDTEWLPESSFMVGPHWGFTGGNVNGQLGGFDQRTLSDQVTTHDWFVRSFSPNASGGNLARYNEMELYLMGFISLEEVASFDMFTGLSNVVQDNVQGVGTIIGFDAANRTTFTPELILERYGRRTPEPANAQKDFKMIVVVVTGVPLTAEQWEVVDTDAEWFGRSEADGSHVNNFWEATGGRATMELGKLDVSLK